MKFLMKGTLIRHSVGFGSTVISKYFFLPSFSFFRLNNEGLGSVIQDLRPSDEVYGRNNSLFGGFPSLFGSGIFGQDPFNSGMFGNIGEPHTESSMSSSMVTIYSNVNGQKSVEKIIRRPDGVSIPAPTLFQSSLCEQFIHNFFLLSCRQLKGLL